MSLGTAANPLRVLLVEDHVDTLDVVARLLKLEGCDVIKAAGYLEALRAAEARPFDLLIADLEMPDGTGWDLLQRLRPNRDFDAIALSAHAFPSAVEKSRLAGFCVHLSKPFHFSALLDAVRKCRHDRPSSPN